MSLQIESAPHNLCKYVHRYCYQQRIQGYQYCIRHILHDKTAPFKQCTFVHQKSKKRCLNAAPKMGERREVLCPFHMTQLSLKKKETHRHVCREEKRVQKKEREAHTNFSANLVKSLEMYCKRHDAPSSNRDLMPTVTAPSDTCPESLKAEHAFSSHKLAKETVKCNDVSVDYGDTDFGMDYSVDCLRFAGILTEKEVLTLARHKTALLKHMYFKALKSVYYKLKGTRREFLHETKNTYKDAGKSKIGQASLRSSKKGILKYLAGSYHSSKRVDKVLRQKNERWQRLHLSEEERGRECVPYKTCAFIQDDKQCSEIVLPCTDYCINHLSSDPKICLFVPCGYGKCTRPVLPIGDNVCMLHLFDTLLPDSKEKGQALSTDSTTEQEHFQSMDDIASLGLDVVTPGSLFGLDQFGEPGESTDTVLSEEQTDLMQIQPITLNPP